MQCFRIQTSLKTIFWKGFIPDLSQLFACENLSHLVTLNCLGQRCCSKCKIKTSERKSLNCHNFYFRSFPQLILVLFVHLYFKLYYKWNLNLDFCCLYICQVFKWIIFHQKNKNVSLTTDKIKKSSQKCLFVMFCIYLIPLRTIKIN